MSNYPLALSSWDKEEIEALQTVIASGNFTMGKYTSTLEEKFAEYVKSKYAVMVNSGSSANLLMIAALFYRRLGPSLERGDEIIVPALGWATTYSPLYQYGLKIKFVDVDQDTLNFNLTELESAIGPSTKAVLAVNLLGNPNDFNSIRNIINSKNKNIILIEDNCESLGATVDGQQAGTFGLMGTFSSFFSHHISTMEGGFIVTNDEEIYHILLSLRAHGWTRNLPNENFVCGQKNKDPFKEAFNFVLPGYNVRPLELSSAVGIEQIKKFPEFLKQRQKNAELFQKKIVQKHSDKFIFQKELGLSSWFGFSMIVRPESGVTREQVLNKLLEHKIDSRPVVTGDFTKNIVVKRYFDYEVHNAPLKAATLVDTNGLFVGNHQIDIEKMLDILDKALEEI